MPNRSVAVRFVQPSRYRLRAGARLAVASDPRHDSVRRRQRHRRGAAGGVRSSRRRTRPADRGRKQRRRRRHARHRDGGQGGARWLQHPRPFLGADHRARDLSRPVLRSDQGSRRGADDRHQRQCDDRAAVAAVEDGAGLHRGRQGQARLDLVRLDRRRQRGAYQRREIPPRRRHRGDPRAVSRRRRGDRRHHRRPDRLLFLSDRHRASADPGRTSACPAGIDPEARGRAAGCAVAGRGRLAQGRDGDLARRVHARENPARDRREIPCRRPEGAR